MNLCNGVNLSGKRQLNNGRKKNRKVNKSEYPRFVLR